MNGQWSVESPSRNVHIITVPARWSQHDFEFSVLLTSDWHFDHPKCQRDLLYGHLDEALAKGAPVIMNGDTFCLMQGKKDKRGSKPDVRPEHRVADYYDAVSRTAMEDLSKYAPVLAVAGYGNHETSIIKHQETDVLRSFVYGMNRKHGSPLQLGGYGGWVFFRFVDPDRKRSYFTVRAKYFHGSGGGGVVTKGVIGTNRRAVMYPDADIIMTGHIHEQWALRTVQERVTSQGRVYHKPQLHVCTSTYKEEYGDGAEGWHNESERPPKPLGGYWLTFRSSPRQRINGKMVGPGILVAETPTL